MSLIHTPTLLDRLELLVLSLPRRGTFHSAIGQRTRKHALLVRWWFPDGSWGIGEASCRADPFFSAEFIDGAVRVISDHLAPLLPARGTLADVVAACARIRGWPFTTAAVLDALLDGLRRQGIPDRIDRWDGPRLRQVPVGVSLGLHPSPQETLAAVRNAVERGFRRIKLKISPTTPLSTLQQVRADLPGHPLSFDANGSFHAAHLDQLAALAALRPLMLEQPFPPGRLDLDQQLKARAPALPLCLDESLTDLGAFYTADALGVLDAANIKPGRVGGQLAGLPLLRWCRDRSVHAWIGGMFETGIGRHANLRMATCLPTAVAHDVSPPLTYLVEDLITPPLHMTNGSIDMTDDRPVTVRWDAVDDACTQRRFVLPGNRGCSTS